MEFNEFLEKQNSIYDKFANSDLSQEGIVPREDLIVGFESYLLAFRHPNNITEPLAEFSERIAKEIPSLVYGPNNAHTTISDYDLNVRFVPDKTILDKFETAIKLSIGNRKAPTINLSDWLYNSNTVIIEGQPSEEFLNLSKKIISNAGKQGIELRLPWGSHITASRFSRPKDPSELQDFYKLMKEAPKLGESKPNCVGIYTQSVSTRGHTLQPYFVASLL